MIGEVEQEVRAERGTEVVRAVKAVQARHSHNSHSGGSKEKKAKGSLLLKRFPPAPTISNL